MTSARAATALAQAQAAKLGEGINVEPAKGERFAASVIQSLLLYHGRFC